MADDGSFYEGALVCIHVTYLGYLRVAAGGFVVPAGGKPLIELRVVSLYLLQKKRLALGFLGVVLWDWFPFKFLWLGIDTGKANLSFEPGQGHTHTPFLIIKGSRDASYFCVVEKVSGHRFFKQKTGTEYARRRATGVSVGNTIQPINQIQPRLVSGILRLLPRFCFNVSPVEINIETIASVAPSIHHRITPSQPKYSSTTFETV